MELAAVGGRGPLRAAWSGRTPHRRRLDSVAGRLLEPPAAAASEPDDRAAGVALSVAAVGAAARAANDAARSGVCARRQRHPLGPALGCADRSDRYVTAAHAANLRLSLQ